MLNLEKIFSSSNITSVDEYINKNSIFILEHTYINYGKFISLCNSNKIEAIKRLNQLKEHTEIFDFLVSQFNNLHHAVLRDDINEVKNITKIINLFVIKHLMPNIRFTLIHRLNIKKARYINFDEPDEVLGLLTDTKNNSFKVNSFEDAFKKYQNLSELEITHQPEFCQDLGSYIRRKIQDYKIRQTWLINILVYKQMWINLDKLAYKHFDRNYKNLKLSDSKEKQKVFLSKTNCKFFTLSNYSYNDLILLEQKGKLDILTLKNALESINKTNDNCIDVYLSRFTITGDLSTGKGNSKTYHNSLLRNLFKVMYKIEEYLEENILLNLDSTSIIKMLCFYDFFNDDPKINFQLNSYLCDFLLSLYNSKTSKWNVLFYNFQYSDIIRRFLSNEHHSDLYKKYFINDNEYLTFLSNIKILLEGIESSNIESFSLHEGLNNLKMLSDIDFALLNQVKSKHKNILEFIEFVFSKANKAGTILLLAKHNFVNDKFFAKKLDSLMKSKNIILSDLILTSTIMRNDKFRDDYKPYVIYVFKKSKERTKVFNVVKIEKIFKSSEWEIFTSNVVNCTLNKVKELFPEVKIKEYDYSQLIPSKHEPKIY